MQCAPTLIARATRGVLLGDNGDRADGDETIQDFPAPRRLFNVADKLAVFDVIAQRRLAPHPHSVFAGGGAFVTDTVHVTVSGFDR